MMAGLVSTAGVASTLSNPSLAYTLFAPTDAAFRAAAASTGVNTAVMMRNRSIVQLVFQYHVVKGVFPTGALKNGMKLPTLVTTLPAATTLAVVG